MYWNPCFISLIIPLSLLNSNIRCIEIDLHWQLTGECEGWIVTLDVLKSAMMIINIDRACWIVTLDVLKCEEDYLDTARETVE